MKRIVILIIALLAPQSASAQILARDQFISAGASIPPIWTATANLYVDCVNGNDSNNGTNPTTQAWKTIAHANDSGGLIAGTVVNVLPGTCSMVRDSTNDAALFLSASGNADTPTGYVVWHSTVPHGAHLISSPSNPASSNLIRITGAYIVLDGFDLDGGGINGAIEQSDTSQGSPHHIILTNNFAHNAGGQGLGVNNTDCIYIAGNESWNNASFQQSARASGISIYEPRIATGCTPGTSGTYFKDYQIIINNNISYGNILRWPTTLAAGFGTADGSCNFTWVSGGKFDSSFAGNFLNTNGNTNYILTIPSSTTMTLNPTCNASTNQSYTITTFSPHSDGNGFILDDWMGTQNFSTGTVSPSGSSSTLTLSAANLQPWMNTLAINTTGSTWVAYPIVSYVGTSVTVTGTPAAGSNLTYQATGLYPNKGLVQGNLAFQNGGGGFVAFYANNILFANNSSYNNYLDALNTGNGANSRGEFSCQSCENIQYVNNIGYSLANAAPLNNNTAFSINNYLANNFVASTVFSTTGNVKWFSNDFYPGIAGASWPTGDPASGDQAAYTAANTLDNTNPSFNFGTNSALISPYSLLPASAAIGAGTNNATNYPTVAQAFLKSLGTFTAPIAPLNVGAY